MFTTCPACYRHYRIHAGQLKAAQGQVRCGYCGEQFNALEHLSDKPAGAHREINIPSQADAAAPRPAPRPAQHRESMTGAGDPEPEFDLPEILHEAERRSPGKMARLGWSLAVILLVVAIIGQAAWFNRDFLLQEYPVLEPWAQRLCERLGCEIIRQHDTSGIKLLNRDVRLHPHYADTLLVNAAMSNRSDARQPYPKIQLSLFDTGGGMIASRIFSPRQYLDTSIDIKKGMSPDQPVHFVLEVTGPISGAVSFEFRFL